MGREGEKRETVGTERGEDVRVLIFLVHVAHLRVASVDTGSCLGHEAGQLSPLYTNFSMDCLPFPQFRLLC